MSGFKGSIFSKGFNQPWVYMCPYMQDSERDTDVKNTLVLHGEDEGGMIPENIIETCLLPYVK